MPKIVDHDERRREIAAVVWRLIATRGLSAVSMRTIAEEAGYANGALATYFAGKDELLRFAFAHIYQATNERVAHLIGDARGLVGLRIFCREVMPLTDETLLEARLATTLWQRAMYDPAMAQLNTDVMDAWRTRIAGFLDDARTAGEIDADVDTALETDALLTSLMGMQVMGVLTRETFDPARQVEISERFIATLGGLPPA
ncbi:TetR family transcriptional regulator C-terminal domain-containing protein [Nocardia sp. R6R-6]|uniref:TetR family transcriptional regulator C-terminal domain-containing protein n=1 Tax=Nocardia sp. R6R-6 TaxID=3459303 RepID=UPI00403D81E1